MHTVINTQHATRNTFHVSRFTFHVLRALGAAAAVAVALAVLWGPWGRAEGRVVAWEGATAWAAPVITGTVTWKGTDQPVVGVQVVLRDAKSNVVLDTATTDAAGLYMLAPGVGDWLVDVPSTATYWGYAQTMTALPHGDYHLDFGITPRPPDAPGAVQAAPPAGSNIGAAPGTSGGTGTPTTTRTPQSGLPPAGHPADPTLPLVGGGILIGAGALLRRRIVEGIRA
jgi:hypothetical protein